jgi:Holliday junction resolvase RusA-like endonuclease
MTIRFDSINDIPKELWDINPELSPERTARARGVLKARPDRLCIIIDHLPSSVLNPNHKAHFYVKHQAFQAAKEEVFILAKQVMGDWIAPDKASISYTFTVKSKRNRDLDNLISSCKAIQDGLVSAGVLKADDCWHLSLGKVEVVKGTVDHTMIEVRNE